MQTIRSRAAAMLLCLLAVFGAVTAHAAEPVDITKKTALSVYFQPKNTPAAKVPFSLYRIADITESGTLKMRSGYTDSRLTITEKDSSEQWRLVATTLTGYVSHKQIAADYTAFTDSIGIARFDTLPQGVYLVTGENYTIGETVYCPTAFLISVPYKDGNGWKYDVSVQTKYDSYDKDKKTDLEIYKVWHDDGSERSRSLTVTLELYDGYTLYDTVVLSKENNWRHVWKDLSAAGDWRLAETQSPRAYITTVEQNGFRFIVNNTLETPTGSSGTDTTPNMSTDTKPSTEPGGSTTNPGGTTTPGGTTHPGTTPGTLTTPSGWTTNPHGGGTTGEYPHLTTNPNTAPGTTAPHNGPGGTTTPGGTTNPEKLPQTGLLRWPIPAMAIAGLFLFAFGWTVRRRNEAEEN